MEAIPEEALELHDLHQFLVEVGVLVLGEKLAGGRDGGAGDVDLGDGLPEGSVLVRAVGQVERLLILDLRLGDDALDVAEYVEGVLDDLLDFILGVGAKAGVGGDLDDGTLLDDLAGDASSVLEHRDVGGKGGGQEEERPQESAKVHHRSLKFKDLLISTVRAS